MIWLGRPTPDDVERLARRLRERPLNVGAGLLDRVDDEPRLPRHLARGWFVDRHDDVVGHGADDFAAARDAFRRSVQFDREWIVLPDDPAPIEVGSVIAYAGRVLGTWWGYGCRILRVIDEPGAFGFVYATIVGHPVRGEERFLVELREDGSVHYSLVAMSRPGRWFAWPAMPIARRVQARFRSASADAMHAALREAADHRS